MNDFMTTPIDPETRQHFADVRAANERARKTEEERLDRVRTSAAETAARLAEDRRKASAERLEADLRKRFFASNPGASEADYQRLAPRLRDEQMAQQTAEVPSVYDKIRAEAAERQQAGMDAASRLDRFTVGQEEAQ